MSGSRNKALSLYKSLLRESQKFEAYNYRNYAIRRTKDAFKENKNLKDANKIEESLEFGKINLDMIRRQVLIGNLYSTDKLVIEK